MYVLQALQEPFPLHAYPFRVWLEFELRLPPALHSVSIKLYVLHFFFSLGLQLWVSYLGFHTLILGCFVMVECGNCVKFSGRKLSFWHWNDWGHGCNLFGWGYSWWAICIKALYPNEGQFLFRRFWNLWNQVGYEFMICSSCSIFYKQFVETCDTPCWCQCSYIRGSKQEGKTRDSLHAQHIIYFCLWH